MDNSLKRRMKTLVVIALCGVLFFATTQDSFAAQVNKVMFNFNTVTRASHTAYSASGSFEATARPGATAEPMCRIAVTAYDSNGHSITTLYMDGTNSASLTLSLSETVGKSGVLSTFMGAFCCAVEG